MSKENSERVLSDAKWITNFGQNYLTSLNGNSAKPISSGKVNQCSFTCPVIVPTAVTALSFGLIMLFLNAVNAQKDDSNYLKQQKV
ncbi:MAG: hypothetical protein ACR5KV_08225 [Wolbachia sp.]